MIDLQKKHAPRSWSRLSRFLAGEALQSYSLCGTHVFLLFLAGLINGLSPVFAFGDEVQTPHAKVSLIANRDWGVVGQSVTVALRFELEPGWHLYWVNPGENGQAPSFRWQLPQGWRLGSTQAPRPQKIWTSGILNYGHQAVARTAMESSKAQLSSSDQVSGSSRSEARFDSSVFYLTQMDLPRKDEPSAGEATLKVRAKWLICKDVCIPAQATLELKLPVRSAGTQELPGEYTSMIERARSLLPERQVELRGVSVRLKDPEKSSSKEPQGRSLELEFAFDSRAEAAGMISALKSKSDQNYFFSAVPELIEPKALQKLTLEGGKLILRTTAVSGLTEIPSAYQKAVPGVLDFGERAIQVEAPLPEDLELSRVDLQDSKNERQTRSDKSSRVQNEESFTYYGALLFALLGGILLNLMPCVFPVLSLKALEFVGHSTGKSANSELRRMGLFYLGGVLTTFWGLAGILALLRAGGAQVGWGFQLQSAGFVSFLGLLLFLMALHLLGVFEVGSRWMGVGSRLTRVQGGMGTWASGMLAVVVATPCTAPFMGTALGFAMTLPLLQSLGIFTALGLGLALPYLGLAFFPAWSRWMPKPGRWLETFKQSMAFPLFATVLWLLWVLGLQKGLNGVLIFCISSVGIGLGAWMWGRWNESDVKTALVWPKYFGIFLTFGAMGAGVFQISQMTFATQARQSAQERAESEKSAHSQVNSGNLSSEPSLKVWHPYSRVQVEKWLSEGRALFIDFTAAWCVTCQANRLAVLGRKETELYFESRKIVRVEADWTNEDPEITQALERFGRNGVPLYVYYPARTAGVTEPAVPRILPQILTFSLIQGAIEKR
jgi:thiol:disulfide interchange protein